MNVTLLDKWRMLQAALADPALTPTAAGVLAVLLDFRNYRTGQCSPAYETLADRIGTKRRATAIGAVRELQQAGWLWVEAGKGRQSNRYIFNFERVANGTENGPQAEGSGTENGPQPSASGTESVPIETVVVRKTHRSGTESVPEPSSSRRDDEEEERPHARAPDGAAQFDRFFAIFPKREREKACRQEFERILTAGEATAAQIVDGARQHVDGKEARYTARPLKWLQDGRWTDAATDVADNTPEPVQRRRKAREATFTDMAAAAAAAFGRKH